MLTPVTLRSTDALPFEVLSAAAGPMFDVEVEGTSTGPTSTQHTVSVRLQSDAPAGPFAATLEIRTSSLDQPVVRVPVFGIAAAPLELDPPVVILRQDGTPVGARRRVKLQAPTNVRLQVGAVRSTSELVKAEVNAEASGRYHHIRFIDVVLSGTAAEGTHHAELIVDTTVHGAPQVRIPVTIIVPPRKG
jgi:hypothetical protein